MPILKARIGGAWVALGGSGGKAIVYNQVTSPQPGIAVGSGAVPITGLTVTYTAVSGHWYKTTVVGSIFNTTVANTTAAMILLNSAGPTTVQSATVPLVIVNSQVAYSMQVVERSLTGSVTRSVVVQGLNSLGGTLNHYSSGTSPAFILVEDITP